MPLDVGIEIIEQNDHLCYSMFREHKRGKGKKDVSVGYLKSLENK